MKPNDTAAQVFELIRDVRVAMLVTQTADGMRSRPMYTMGGPEDGGLWFFTDVTTSKVEEIERHPNVLVSYAARGANDYVSIFGRASVVRDPARAQQFWNIHAKAWFPGGPDDPNLALLRVEPTHMEYWDGPNRLVYALSLVKAVATGGAPAGGSHSSIEFSG